MEQLRKKLDLGCYPTPLKRLKQIEEAFSLTVPFYVKREDLSGLGPGGNKVRCMEYLLFDAVKKGCSIVVASGPYESNLCTTVAAACAALSLNCILVYNCAPPKNRRGNMLLNQISGAREVFLGPCEGSRRNEEAGRITAELNKNGKKAYLIENGASTGLGILGYIGMLREIKEQLKPVHEGRKAGRIFVPGGNGGIAAGLICGNILENQPFDITVLSVEHRRDELKARIEKLIEEAVPLIGPIPGRIEELCEIKAEYAGGGWGKDTAKSKKMAETFPRLTGIYIDHIYCSKTVVGAIEETAAVSGKSRAGGDKSLPAVYIHTGGFASLFAQYDGSLGIRSFEKNQ